MAFSIVQDRYIRKISNSNKR